MMMIAIAVGIAMMNRTVLKTCSPRLLSLIPRKVITSAPLTLNLIFRLYRMRAEKANTFSNYFLSLMIVLRTIRGEAIPLRDSIISLKISSSVAGASADSFMVRRRF